MQEVLLVILSYCNWNYISALINTKTRHWREKYGGKEFKNWCISAVLIDSDTCGLSITLIYWHYVIDSYNKLYCYCYYPCFAVTVNAIIIVIINNI